MSAPIELYFWATPNGYKIAIALEEMGLPYKVTCVDINKGDQFHPAFLKISPNNKMPAIIDPDGPGGAPISVFESGAILQYLGRKSGQFYPRDERQRVEAEQWLYWQVGGLGPMSGQAGHFRNYAPKLITDTEQLAYGRARYVNEVNRLYGVLERRLADRDYIAGAYSIADIAAWPWMRSPESYDQDFAHFPRIKAWFDRIAARPAVQRALAIGKALNCKTISELSADELSRSAKVLFGQNANTVTAFSTR